MFQTFVVQPIFNLLVAIYTALPGHNFGIALIVFTVVVRLLLWPLVKKQLHQTKLMRKLQPELKRVKKEAAGDKQKESIMMLDLYKEKGVNPLGSLPVLIVQMIVLIGLYTGLMKIVRDPQQIYHFAYPFLQATDWLQHLSKNIHLFDNTLFGLVDLSRPAVGPKGLYVPALILVLLSAGMQFITSKQILPSTSDSPKFKDILKAAGDGQQADQAEVSAAVSRSMVYVIPVMVLFFTVNFAAALSLYWFVGSLVAYFQQKAALAGDVEDMEELASTPNRPVKKGTAGSKITIMNTKDIPEAEIVTTPQNKQPNTAKKGGKKRRR